MLICQHVSGIRGINAVFHRIGIVAKTADQDVRAALQTTLAVLNKRGSDVVLDENSASVNDDPNIPTTPEQSIATDRDLIVAIGGDGTLLRAAKLAFAANVPVTGVNLGRLGFLTDLTPADVPHSLERILNGKFASEQRCVLRAELRRGDEVVAAGDGLNDVVLQKWHNARLISFDTYVDNRFVLSQRSDGLIVSTPTGSTAYSLSGGGPILDPGIRALVLVPICPHALTNRPIVLADTATIELRVQSEYADESRVTCDGEPMPTMRAGDVVRITRHTETVHLIHPDGHDHFANLRAKLHWGRAPC